MLRMSDGERNTSISFWLRTGPRRCLSLIARLPENRAALGQLSGPRNTAVPDELKARQEKLTTVQGEIANVTDAIAKVGLSSALETKLTALEAQAATLESAVIRLASQASLDGPMRLMRAMRNLKQRLQTMDTSNMSRSQIHQAREALRGLVGPVHWDGETLQMGIVAGRDLRCPYYPSARSAEVIRQPESRKSGTSHR